MIYDPTNETTRNNDDFLKKLNPAIEDAKGKLIIIGDLNARVAKRGWESFVVGKRGENVRNGNRREYFCVLNKLIITNIRTYILVQEK